MGVYCVLGGMLRSVSALAVGVNKENAATEDKHPMTGVPYKR